MTEGDRDRQRLVELQERQRLQLRDALEGAARVRQALGRVVLPGEELQRLADTRALAIDLGKRLEDLAEMVAARTERLQRGDLTPRTVAQRRRY